VQFHIAPAHQLWEGFVPYFWDRASRDLFNALVTEGNSTYISLLVVLLPYCKLSSISILKRLFRSVPYLQTNCGSLIRISTLRQLAVDFDTEKALHVSFVRWAISKVSSIQSFNLPEVFVKFDTEKALLNISLVARETEVLGKY